MKRPMHGHRPPAIEMRRSVAEVPPASAPAPSSAIEIRRGIADDDAERDAYVLAHARGTFFHRAGWRRVVEFVLGHEPSDWVARSNGALVGVLPLMRAPSLTTHRALISMPYAVYGGALGDSREIELALVRAATQQAEREGASRVELRYVDDPGLELAASNLYATFIADLPASVEQVLARMPKKARAEARKAREKHGLRLTEGIWYLDDLFRLYQTNKRSLGSPGLPHKFFWHLRKEFGDEVRVHAVHQGSDPIAAVMSFVWRNELVAYYSGSADGADKSFSASNFMYMALQEWGVERGLTRFDFGRSRKDSGAFSFKEHQGFAARDLNYRFHLVGNSKLPSLNPSNPRTKPLRDLWSKLPVSVTTRLSAPLSRYLP